MSCKKRKFYCKNCIKITNENEHRHQKTRRTEDSRPSELELPWNCDRRSSGYASGDGKWLDYPISNEPPVRPIRVSSSSTSRSKKRKRKITSDEEECPREGDVCACNPHGRSKSRFDKMSRHGSMTSRDPSTSLVTEYMNKGLEQVASFIVESAIRFGQEQGVVVPEDGESGVLQLTCPMLFDDRKKKIRFKIPEGTLAYEDAKKAMWRSKRNGAHKKCHNHLRHKTYNAKKLNRRHSPTGDVKSDSAKRMIPVGRKCRKESGALAEGHEKETKQKNERTWPNDARKTSPPPRTEQMDCDDYSIFPEYFDVETDLAMHPSRKGIGHNAIDIIQISDNSISNCRSILSDKELRFLR